MSAFGFIQVSEDTCAGMNRAGFKDAFDLVENGLWGIFGDLSEDLWCWLLRNWISHANGDVFGSLNSLGKLHCYTLNRCESHSTYCEHRRLFANCCCLNVAIPERPGISGIHRRGKQAEILHRSSILCKLVQSNFVDCHLLKILKQT